MSRLDVRPLDSTFGAIVSGAPLTDLSEDETAELRRLWVEHGLLIFPDQHLDRHGQNDVARLFGELEFPSSPLTNLDEDGNLRPDDGSDDAVNILRGNMGWHMDSTYLPVQAKGAVFTAAVVPASGGATGWADTWAGYDALDEATRERISGLSAYHSIYHSQALIGDDRTGSDRGYGFFGQDPPLRPLIKVHPETGRRGLVIGRHAYGIPGLGEVESAELLDHLVEVTCQPPRVHYHEWSVGDAVVWDNRRLLHRATPWDLTEPRVMYHARIAGDPETEFAAAA